MHVGDKVKLTGITQHGKNRVREQSDVWEVIRMSPTVSFKTSASGPFMLLQPPRVSICAGFPPSTTTTFQ